MANWLKNLLVKEISLVDRPANPGAVHLLAKRDEPIEKDMYGVSRFADLISSLGYLLRSSEYEAKEEGDNSQVPAALRTWLKQGVPIFQAMATEEINELLAVSTAKRDGKPTAKFVALSKAMDRATGALSESVKSIVGDKDAADKPKLIDETIKQFSEHVEDELEKTLSGDAPGADEGEDAMSPEIKKVLGLADSATDAEVTAAVVKLAAAENKEKDAKIAKLESELDVAKAAMSADEKTHHDTLKTDEAKAKFRASSKEDRGTAMKKGDDLPPHIRKALEDGEEMKKALAVLVAKDELVTFTKRAVDIGLTETQGDLLMKAHKGDAAALKKLEDCIKGLNEQIATGKVFAEFGSNNGRAADAYDEIMEKGEELRKVTKGLTIEQARAKVIEDPANRDLMKRYKEEQRARTRDA